eukprot:m.233566 g.233566  ORF g.233566 m.233566 type:complete len:446 (+) comp12533_c0_seq1:25-1362(+)
MAASLRALASALGPKRIIARLGHIPPRPDPFEPVYKLGDKSLLRTIKSKETEFDKLVQRLSQVSLGRLGPAVSPVVKPGVEFEKAPKPPTVVPRFKLLDDAEAVELVETTTQVMLAEQRRPAPLKFPPVETLSKDPEAGNKRFKFAFLDLSSGHDVDELRPAYIREEDGTLRTANAEERDKINLNFFVQPFKKQALPKKFDDANLPALLADNLHADILDEVVLLRKSHQPDYVRVHRAVYEDIETRQIYSVLQETPHWRDFFAFLAEEKRLIGIVTSLLEARRIDDATNVVRTIGRYSSLEEFAKQNKRLAGLLERVKTRPPEDSPRFRGPPGGPAGGARPQGSYQRQYQGQGQGQGQGGERRQRYGDDRADSQQGDRRPRFGSDGPDRKPRPGRSQDDGASHPRGARLQDDGATQPRTSRLQDENAPRPRTPRPFPPRDKSGAQ